MRRFLALLPIVLASVPCRAQEAFDFSWQVRDIAGTGPTNSNGIIEPGEDAHIFFYVSMQPGIGGAAIWNTNGGTGQPGTVEGLGFVAFGIIGTQGLDTGTWTVAGFPPNFNIGLPGSVNPNNDLRGIGFAQFLLPGQAPDQRNNDWFYRVKWRPLDYLPRTVGFRFQGEEGGGVPYVLLDVGLRDPMGFPIYKPDTWGYNEPTGSFMIVPGPSAAAVMAGAALLVARRRRRRF
ncbi:MAG: hypothetical protein ACKVW3_16240 [Phycisphaerales bacterium]